ncbi:hypothetical protein LIA77_06034 [Sarocladium implicatum]|nr:hypothetical protein LIA77_06034 [Sarocladium implicatum]
MGLIKTSMILAAADRMHARHEMKQQQNSGYAPPPPPPPSQQYGPPAYHHTSRHAERRAQRVVRRDMRHNPPMPHAPYADYGGSYRGNDGYNQGYQGGYYDGREAGSCNQGYYDGYESRDAQRYYEGPRNQYAGYGEGSSRGTMSAPRYEGGYGGQQYQQQERGIVDVPEGQSIETAPPAYKQ